MEKTVRSLGETSTWSATQLSRVTRLIRLITEMKTNPRQTPETLSAALGISRSQYFQDKMLLEKAFGFKVKFNRAKRSYEILEDPYLPIINLKLSEAFALILAVRQLSASGDYILTYEAMEGIKKIVASAQPELRSFMQNVLDENVLRQGFGCDASILESLRQACAEHHHVIITYEHYDQDALWPHTIDPYQLFFRRRALYLDTYDRGTRALRVFRVNRIKKLEFTGLRGVMVTDYSFAKRFHDSFSTFVGEGTTTVKVRFTKRIAPYIRESLWHWSQRLSPLPDGGVLYEVQVSYPREVAWWAMSWGSEAEVLEPPELRAYVAEEGRKMAGLYERWARLIVLRDGVSDTAWEKGMPFLEVVREAARKRLLFLPHAIDQMNRPERMISPREVREVIFSGQLIEDYPEDPRGHLRCHSVICIRSEG